MQILHRFLSWIGKYTLELYILHMLIMGALQRNTVISAEVKTIITICGAFALCVPIHSACEHIKCLQLIKNSNGNKSQK